MAGPLVPEDIYNFRWIDHVRLNPAADRVAYVVFRANRESRENTSRIVVRRITDAEPFEASAGTTKDHSPEWSPDGRSLAFVSKKGASNQVFVLDASGAGDPVQVSSVPEGASSPAWSTDGSHIAFIGRVVGDPDSVVDDDREPESSNQARRTPVARVVRRLDYKHDGGGYDEGRNNHLFVVSAVGADAKQVTSGPWSVEGFDWSPDGTSLAVAGNAEPDADRQLESHLYRLDIDGNLTKLATALFLNTPLWSPRGDLIAYLAPNGNEAGLLDRIWVVPATGGKARCITLGFDQSVGDGLVSDMRAGHGLRLRWSPTGDRIYFPASGPGVTSVYSVDLDGNVRQEVGGQRRIYDFDVVNGVFAHLASDTTSSGELYVVTNGAEGRLTDLNPWLRDRYIAQPERHEFTSPDGWRIQGWLIKPDGFDASKRYPLVMEVHGGPHAQYGWALFHEFQILAGKGFLVFYVNPRGSDGYGETFMKAVVRDWGGKDFVDLMTALDQLIERTGFVDTSRMGIGGGSYGGYMTNWAIGQTDRFAAAVSMRSISNLVSEYAQHDIVIWGGMELGPPPWPDADELWKRSPIRYVQNMKTPLLLTHGEMDLRCAVSQAEELFGALRLLGKTAELVRFPDESHDLSRNGRPDRRVERLRRIAGWFERFLGTMPSEAPAAPAKTPEPVGASPEPEPLAMTETAPGADVAVTQTVPVMDVAVAETVPVADVAVTQTVPVMEVAVAETVPVAVVAVADTVALPEASAPYTVAETIPVGEVAVPDVNAPAPEPASVADTLPPAPADPVTALQPVTPAPAAPFAVSDTLPPAPASLEPAQAQPTRQEIGVGDTLVAWPNPHSAAAAGEATSVMPAWQAIETDPASEQAFPAGPVAPPDDAPATLIFLTGPGSGRVVGLKAHMAMIGRGQDNDVVLDDPATSSHHCRIEARNGAFWLADLGSTNGTLINGEPVVEKQLQHGDVVSIGQNTIRFALKG